MQNPGLLHTSLEALTQPLQELLVARLPLLPPAQPSSAPGLSHSSGDRFLPLRLHEAGLALIGGRQHELRYFRVMKI